MLNVTKSPTIVAKLAPKEDHVEDQIHYAMDCRLVTAVMTGADDLLAALRVPSLKAALWDKDGVPLLQEGQIKLRHKIGNVRVTIEGKDEAGYVEVTGDLSQIKLTPLPAFGIEFDVKLKGRCEPDQYIAIWGLRIDGNASVVMSENQVDIEAVAA